MADSNTALAEYDADLADAQQERHEARTPADYRTESVARTLDAAYSRASTLVLTPDEANALAADFPDEAFRLGAGGDPDLIYIEHAYLRQRLNEVLGVGAAVPIRRREWVEEYTYYSTTKKKECTGVRVYVDLVLLVRGCVVGESIAEGTYYPDNAKTNYSDALESAKSNAFRRCCKEFGVGLQAWMKGWGDGWKSRNGRTQRKDNGVPAKQQRGNAKQPDKPAIKPPAGWPKSTPEQIQWWAEALASGAQCKDAVMFAGAAKLHPTMQHGVFKAIHQRYHTLLAGRSASEQEKAAKLTEWFDKQLKAAERDDLEVQGQAAFGGGKESEDESVSES